MTRVSRIRVGRSPRAEWPSAEDVDAPRPRGTAPRALAVAPRALAVGAVLLTLMCGCGAPPDAVFVSSQRAKELIPPVQSRVRQSVDGTFGNPQALIASLDFPIDYGVLEGQVRKADGEHPDRMIVDWADDPTSERMKSLDPAGAALVWNTGINIDAVLKKPVGRKTQEVPADFHVDGWRSKDSALTLSLNMAKPDRGDKFRVVGHVLQNGRRLYMQHCMHCHGVSGDGNGPTAPYLNPKPRDYRLGVFKFTSTGQAQKPSRDDLDRIIRQGIPGTYMPSFLLLKKDELHAIIEYVRWLSIRGEFEKRLVDSVYGDYSKKALDQRLKSGEKQSDIEKAVRGDGFAEDYNETLQQAVTGLAKLWTVANDPAKSIQPKMARIDPAADAASIERGRKLYLSDKTKCASCHGPQGKGDGPQTVDVQKRGEGGGEYPAPGLFDAWENEIRPRDLTQGIYRGGRRPVDLYRRINVGIKGTPMPAFGTALKDNDIWDLVNYVMSVPYKGKAPSAQKVAGHQPGEPRPGGVAATTQPAPRGN